MDRRKIATGLSARDLSHFYMDSTISLNRELEFQKLNDCFYKL